MTNPYRGLNDFCFWPKAMSAPAPGHVDPVTRSVRIDPKQKIVTMGSCFAQHLSRHIRQSGFNYHVTERAPDGMSAQEAATRNYAVFSARYGNVYTVRQALQLLGRAFGIFKPVEVVWRRGDRFVDAFRPRIEPDGFATEDEVIGESRRHLECVRQVFASADWFVFTLGLTEAWRSRLDGAIYPLAPGVAGGVFDPERHEFVNFSATQVRDDLNAFITGLGTINPHARVLLTVSPVPLIATYEKRHVWASTTFSKSALRVAADEAERRFPNVIYFPSYEVITSPAAGGRYYSDDLRQVTELGVRHVMRLFGKHFLLPAETAVAEPVASAAFWEQEDVVCDEEVIERALRTSGY